ncbi:hypothetical protein NLM33_19945 [Bradyrhizobium sp. CCGUVB1N3]|uniref:hypothetical protein n=1 Tax=Bradyrhizobium sp. CCGUVB1N3 TaxID=2949629 RepID=UPI0020B3D671|nr:hypothetical protein [Bradyrhizobium sp. CCGUVB1N3]MCP3472589.1 hypothetical protein [Bradyrhizobium sp. CCGUVB1N3]
MSMLTHRFEQPFRPLERKSVPEAWISNAHAATIRRVCLGTLALLSMGSVLTVLIALKTVIFMQRFHF